MNTLKIGKLDELKSINQYRLILFKTDILKIFYPYLQSNNIEFLTYNRRKQYFLLRYIIENKIIHWDNLNLEEINNLFQNSNKQFNFSDIINLPYFNNWLIGFTIAEGSFHKKANGRCHFSIVQSGHENYQIIKSIHYLIKGSESLNHKINPENDKVYRISFSSKKDLLFIVEFFEKNKLLGLKKLQFDNWKSKIRLAASLPIKGSKVLKKPDNNNKLNSSAPNVISSDLSNSSLKASLPLGEISASSGQKLYKTVPSTKFEAKKGLKALRLKRQKTESNHE